MPRDTTPEHDAFAEHEAREYWERHVELRGAVDWVKDPEGLSNVCHPGAPGWLNEYYARHQRAVFDSLVGLVGSSGVALDIGCGAARWSVLLAQRGFSVTGVDLQAALLERNRATFPSIRFVQASAEQFSLETKFDLGCSVTVLQHMPYAQQAAAVANIARHLKVGGYYLMLENVRDRAPHVFSRSIPGWCELFAANGFARVAERRYDYSFVTRGVQTAGRAARRPRRGSATPETLLTKQTRKANVLARAYYGGLRVAVAVDGAWEEFLINRQFALPTVHCGFLFRYAP